jgi:glycosyltransferase involved in cell wall biosynthesis
MKIAQVAPLYESVPPKLYGGTERVVAYLTDELVSMGHDVTLLASGDSNTKAKLEEIVPKALRLENHTDANIYNILQLQRVIDLSSSFDIIHFHTDYFHFPTSCLKKIPHITTLHGRLDIDGLGRIYERFAHVPIVSISYSQRKPIPHANWIGNVYHGLPLDLHSMGDGGGGYAAFIGRISPEKRVDRAIAIAERAGIRIKIAAKVDKVDKEYFDQEIKHLLKKPHVEYLGEIGEAEKTKFLGDAVVTLFPIDWPEPFGMVMIESLACGTPVIAFGHGSVPEVLDDRRTGFIVNSIEAAAAAVSKISSIDRRICRQTFLERFTARRMATDYFSLYTNLIEEHKHLNFSVKDEIDMSSKSLSA